MRRIYEQIKRAVSAMGTDGLLHLSVSALLMTALGWIKPLFAGVLAVLLIGIVKECYDYFSKKGTPEVKDLICDCIGIVLGLLVILLNSLG